MYQKLNQYDCTLESYNSIQSKLTNEFQQTLSKKKVFLAIDGYIDSLYSVIKTRENSNNYTEFKTIKELADRLYRIQGSSGNLEIKLKKKTSGGFVPNNGKALSTLNINVSLFGALGYPEICDIFKPMITKKNIDLFSYNNPAKTVGLEFNDGKIMLSDFQNLSHIKWGLITDRVGSDMIFHKLEDSDAIGFGYWSLNPALSNIWKNLTDTIFPSIKDLNKKLFFIDLGDLKKCTKPNILEMVKIVQNIEKQIPVLLSLNDQEAIDLSSILKCKTPIKPNKNSFMDFIDAGELLNKELKLSYLVIHSPHFATISLKKNEKHYWITEGFTSKPSYTVSAGDHFLSGVITGFLGNLDSPESILIGNALTAIFVRTGFSPNFNQLKLFTKNYMDYIENDNPNFPYNNLKI